MTAVPRWEIVEQVPRKMNGTHTHVAQLHIADGLAGEVREVAAYEAIRQIEAGIGRYFTVGVASGEESPVLVVECHDCGKKRLATRPANPDDADLDSMPGFWESTVAVPTSRPVRTPSSREGLVGPDPTGGCGGVQ